MAAVLSVGATPHPFDDLSAEEIATVLELVRASGKFSPEVRFPVVRRREPRKAEWLSGAAKDTRAADVVVFDFKPLDGADVVLWYTFGVTHVPHPEEWPIMNVHHTGFTLVPMNFFTENPAMTLKE